ncbi:Fc.00g029300.m01.CDS01 [Cosmosporella sp. VM-42]
MSLSRHTAHALTPRARVSLFVSNGRNPCKTLIRDSPYAGRRNLHVGAAVGDAVRMTADAFTWVHSSTGMPWYLTIPLLAVGVNLTFRLPLQYYVARLREKRKELDPLVAAWARRHTNTIIRKQPNLPDRILSLRIAGSVEKSRRRIYKTWGVQRFKGLAPLLGMFPFITISEALRRKCGAPLGWISHSIGLGNAEGVQSNLGTASSMFDPSFANGGCLWFVDLTSMDPFFGLPMLCTALLGYSTWGRMSKDHLRALLTLGQNKNQVIALTNIQKALGRTMLLVPVFPLLFADLPSAIFLYWASSFALTNVNEVILNRLVPKKTPRLKVETRKSSAAPYLLGKK